MANTQLGGAETIDSYRKKIMTILKKSGRTPVSDRDLATKCRTNRGGAALASSRQYRTKIVRQMRRQIFRQMKQKAE